MTRTRLLTPVFVLLFVGLLGAGCDSGSSGGGGIIAPDTSEVAFNVQPNTSESKSFTISYSGLSERPTVDTTGIPDAYAIEVAEENGSPGNGATTFNVTFNGPGTPGGYATPVRLRASGTTATMRLSGTVLGIFTVADFEDGIEGFFPFGVGIQRENGQLRIDGANVGGPGQYPGFGTSFGGPTDFGITPVVAARIKVASSSDGPAILRAALNTADGSPNADQGIEGVLKKEVPGIEGVLKKEVPADGEYATYYFDFRGNFFNYEGREVDPTKIRELVFLVNDDNPDTFSGTIYIDEINRRQNIPE